MKSIMGTLAKIIDYKIIDYTLYTVRQISEFFRELRYTVLIIAKTIVRQWAMSTYPILNTLWWWYVYLADSEFPSVFSNAHFKS